MRQTLCPPLLFSRALPLGSAWSVMAGIMLSLGVLSLPLKAQRVVGSEMVKLTFPNADVRDVLAQYELLVGKHLIYDNAITGQVNINVPDVPKDVAIRIIEITLIMNGFHIVPVDSDPMLLKVVGVGRAPRTIGIPLIADPEPVPDGEQVVMYLVKLQYADPNEMVQILSQAMPPSRTEYGPSVVALPKSQSLLITENTTIIRTLQRIIRAADVRPTEVEGEFITLQRASAKDVVQMLEKLFEKQDKPATPGAPRPATPSPAAPAPGGQQPPAAAAPASMTVEIGGMTEDSMISGKVRLTADERTNRIYVVSRPVNLPLLRKLIQDFDEDVRFDEPAVRLLKYVSSGDILEALVKAISDPGNKDAAGASGSTPRTSGGTQPAQTGGNLSQFSNGSGNRGTGSSSLSSNLSLQTEARIVTPNTVLVGNARVMADNRRNAIIVIGSADVREKVFKLLEQLDVRAPQVMLSTIIGELTLSSGEQLGLNYILNNGQRSALSAPVTAGTSTTSFAGPISIDSNGLPKLNLSQLLSDTRFARLLTGGATGVSGFVAAGDSMSALVTALESTSRFKVTSRPSVFASNNKKATIASGDEVAVATSIQSGVTGTGANPLVTNSNVSYKPIELRLEVVPLINSDREVYLDIFQQVQEQTDTTVVDNNRYPRISTRALNTSVMVPNEGTLVLGGLIKQAREKQNSGIPFLSRAPLIGPLFRSSTSSEKRTELVIMIRPSVTLGPEEDIGVRDRNLRPMQIPSNIEDTLGEDNSERRKTKPVAVPFRSASDVVRPVVVNPVGAKTEPSAVPVSR